MLNNKLTNYNLNAIQFYSNLGKHSYKYKDKNII